MSDLVDEICHILGPRMALVVGPDGRAEAVETDSASDFDRVTERMFVLVGEDGRVVEVCHGGSETGQTRAEALPEG